MIEVPPLPRTIEAVVRLRRLVGEQATEIDQLRTELAAANERALEPAERATAAIQVVEAILEWKNDPTKPDDVHWASVLDALKLWEAVR